jgi:cation diffusion facilitator family transporter
MGAFPIGRAASNWGPVPGRGKEPAVSEPVEAGLRASGTSLALNLILAGVKIATGVAGNSYALVADGIESTVDVLSSLVVWGGLRLSRRPPDRTHPYGHGKAESIAGILVAASLLGAAALIVGQSVREIRTPHHAPAWFTLPVLLGVVVLKETMFRYLHRTGDHLESTSLRADAWHHRSDALTSLAAFVGITIALVGGPGYETADDWAALAACTVIVFNAVRLARPAVDEVMDAAIPPETVAEIRSIAAGTPGVAAVEKCRVRKSGLGLLMDIHVEVDPELTVREGHSIGHRVADRLKDGRHPIVDVVVHVEPADEGTRGERATGGG